jgi:tRNA-2-methylthio-N6-dimethylallyladenosine synthase
MEGKIYKVLVEGDSIKDNQLFGYTETSKLVNFTGKGDLVGKIVNVKITSAKSFSLDGEVVE